MMLFSSDDVYVYCTTVGLFSVREDDCRVEARGISTCFSGNVMHFFGQAAYNPSADVKHTNTR